MEKEINDNLILINQLLKLRAYDEISELIYLNQYICTMNFYYAIKDYKLIGKIDRMNNIFCGNIGHNILTPTHSYYVQKLDKYNYKPNQVTKIILDVETENYYNNIVQICYFVLDNNNNILSKNMFYVYNGQNIQDHFKKIPIFTLKTFGIHPCFVFNKLRHDLQYCDEIIGHNISFDIDSIKQNAKKCGIELKFPPNIFCTMKESKNIVKCVNKNNQIKFPKLIEMCKFFNVEFLENSFHDAQYDVEKTFECYLQLINK